MEVLGLTYSALLLDVKRFVLQSSENGKLIILEFYNSV